MSQRQASAFEFIFFPSVAMLLGWGLRGYIGGGPFGAMIPGSFVALSLSMMLGHKKEAAAMAALFGAIGIGFGGDMTYGQTLGFLRDAETVSWGLLGCTVKGAVWGLLGCAVLAVGLTRNQYKYTTLLAAFAVSIVAFYIGIKLINEPKLIYFSNRLDRPRDESWAGLLFAAIAFLSFLRWRAKGEHAGLPLRFAGWGALGGALGFGGGALWMVIGPKLPLPQQWFGWWKAMEFSFGAILGAAIGLAGYRNRDQISDSGKNNAKSELGLGSFLGLVAIVLAGFFVLPFLARAAGDSPVAGLVRFVLMFLRTFTVFGFICLALGLRSPHTAWQVAITLTFFHTVLDMNEDMFDHGGITWEPATLATVLIVFTAGMALLVGLCHRHARAVPILFLSLVAACYGVSCVKTFLYRDYFIHGLGYMLTKDPAIVLVHLIFTVSTIVTSAYIYVFWERSVTRGIGSHKVENT
ncbi:MAG: hypothetical protein AMXMBFR84_25280 [Candidatus Hydrogenedentota bacterium]